MLKNKKVYYNKTLREVVVDISAYSEKAIALTLYEIALQLEELNHILGKKKEIQENENL